MSTVTYLITGASRGIGLETTRQLLAYNKSFRVIAAARDPDSASQLQDLLKGNENRLYLIKADVTDEKSIQTAANELEKYLGKDGIDVLINNAGVAYGGLDSALDAKISDFKLNMETNVYGVVNATLGFLPLLRKGSKKQIFVVSSLLASIGGPLSQTSMATSYSVSKTAVNMWLVKLGRDLEPEGFTTIPLHPGYVSTDINGNSPGGLQPVDAVRMILENVILHRTQSDNLKFLNYEKGETLPW